MRLQLRYRTLVAIVFCIAVLGVYFTTNSVYLSGTMFTMGFLAVVVDKILMIGETEPYKAQRILITLIIVCCVCIISLHLHHFIDYYFY